MSLLSPLWLVLAALLLAAGWMMRSVSVEDNWKKVLDPRVMSYLRPTALAGQSLLLAFVIAAIIALALSAPATVKTSDKEAKAHAESWWVLVDISESMLQDDIVPSRLDAAKRYLMQLREAAGARPLGMIIYAGDAFLAHPPTFDRQTFDDFARVLDTELIDVQGSRPHRALGLAQTILGERGSAYARLWLLTDSGGINALSLQIAQQLANDGHRLDVVLTAIPGSQEPEPVSLDKAQALADAGHGNVTSLNALGEADAGLDSLSSEGEQQAMTLRLGGYTLWSQWILLLLLPVVLLLMRRWQT